jgi:hypothetical protein
MEWVRAGCHMLGFDILEITEDDVLDDAQELRDHAEAADKRQQSGRATRPAIPSRSRGVRHQLGRR